MKRSIDRILTTHVGSLVKPDDLETAVLARERGEPHDETGFPNLLQTAVADVVRQQASTGIDIVNDGEFSKSSWGAYFRSRLANVESRPGQGAARRIFERDAKVFPDWFERAQAAGGPRFSYVLRGAAALKGKAEPAIDNSRCVGPLKYIGQADLQRDIENLQAAGAPVNVEELCMTALAPPIMTSFLQNDHYATQEEFLFAIAEAMNEEYRTIAESGILLQLDEPSVATHWHILTDMSVADYRKWLELRVEVLNVALKGVPEERVRMHTCWGSVHHPHTADIPLENILDLILKVNVGGYSWEASNPRHDHEWQVWKDIRLPEGKVLIPGVIGHYTDWVEHPRLIAERIQKYASVVGRENVIAGVDCGLGTRVGSESILWAKLGALAEGARIASDALWS
ncbi:MAG TPA: cobalamin-independent methionine synthase II family protein [Dehalococcoidia bacterium]|nr:cobalamin-independent methionine synthase II family protein [Dehalococcoidia bacterium]